MKRVIRNIDDYGEIVEHLSCLLGVGDCLLLHGEMGVGKTHLARILIRHILGDASLLVSSPTFSLLNIYGGAVPIYHYDLYRLRHRSELLELGFEEAFSLGISIIEWGDILGSQVPRGSYHVHLQEVSEDERILELKGGI